MRIECLYICINDVDVKKSYLKEFDIYSYCYVFSISEKRGIFLNFLLDTRWKNFVIPVKVIRVGIWYFKHTGQLTLFSPCHIQLYQQLIMLKIVTT